MWRSVISIFLYWQNELLDLFFNNREFLLIVDRNIFFICVCEKNPKSVNDGALDYFGQAHLVYVQFRCNHPEIYKIFSVHYFYIVESFVIVHIQVT